MARCYIFWSVLGVARSVEMREVTESLRDEISPSDLAANMLCAFLQLRKVTCSFAMSVRPHETTLKPMDGFS
jgi:hypothetical protein